MKENKVTGIKIIDKTAPNISRWVVEGGSVPKYMTFFLDKKGCTQIVIKISDISAFIKRIDEYGNKLSTIVMNNGKSYDVVEAYKNLFTLFDHLNHE